MCIYSLQDVCQDGLIRVSLMKVFKPTDLTILVTLTSMRQRDTALTIVLGLPSNLQCSLDGVEVGTGADSASLTVVVGPFGTVSCRVIDLNIQPSTCQSVRHLTVCLSVYQTFDCLPVCLSDI